MERDLIIFAEYLLFLAAIGLSIPILDRIRILVRDIVRDILGIVEDVKKEKDAM